VGGEGEAGERKGGKEPVPKAAARSCAVEKVEKAGALGRLLGPLGLLLLLASGSGGKALLLLVLLLVLLVLLLPRPLRLRLLLAAEVRAVGNFKGAKCGLRGRAVSLAAVLSAAAAAVAAAAKVGEALRLWLSLLLGRLGLGLPSLLLLLLLLPPFPRRRRLWRACLCCCAAATAKGERVDTTSAPSSSRTPSK
jgi:hypothetical protein